MESNQIIPTAIKDVFYSQLIITEHFSNWQSQPQNEIDDDKCQKSLDRSLIKPNEYYLKIPN